MYCLQKISDLCSKGSTRILQRHYHLLHLPTLWQRLEYGCFLVLSMLPEIWRKTPHREQNWIVASISVLTPCLVDSCWGKTHRQVKALCLAQMCLVFRTGTKCKYIINILFSVIVLFPILSTWKLSRYVSIPLVVLPVLEANRIHRFQHPIQKRLQEHTGRSCQTRDNAWRSSVLLHQNRE